MNKHRLYRLVAEETGRRGVKSAYMEEIIELSEVLLYQIYKHAGVAYAQDCVEKMCEKARNKRKLGSSKQEDYRDIITEIIDVKQVVRQFYDVTNTIDSDMEQEELKKVNKLHSLYVKGDLLRGLDMDSFGE